MRLKPLGAALLAALLTGCATPPPSSAPAAANPSAAAGERATNVLFFLGDGMGINTLTAARIYAVGEAGELAIDTLPESAFVKTFSKDFQVTDSAASMSAYMTGVKQNNGVVSMSADTEAVAPGADGASRCRNGQPAPTLGELAKARGLAVGVVTTTSVTDATPAAVYAHACHRKLQMDIAAMLVPGGAGANPALGQGLDLVFGGGSQYFKPAGQGGQRRDGRDLVAELQARGYRSADSAAAFAALAPEGGPAIALFAPDSLAYDAERDPARQPTLAEMTRKAIALLDRRSKDGANAGFFLVVEGGRIDHALHATHAKRALQETVQFDLALRAALDEMRRIDPGLKHTLVVATADHDHTLLINGYSPRSGPSTDARPGVLGLVRALPDGKIKLDKDGAPYTVLGFGTGEHRVDGSRAARAGLSDSEASADDYHQEAAIRTAPGAETHGGADVYLGAAGAGADAFRGTIDNTRVFSLIKEAAGW